MSVLIQHLGGVERDFAMTPLPAIKGMGDRGLIKLAFDKAVNARQIVAVQGPKGIGKSYGLDAARRWFSDMQASRLKQDARYTPLKAVEVRGLRGDTYKEVLAEFIHTLDRREPLRVSGRGRGETELRQRACQLLSNQNVALVVVDEMELVKNAVLQVICDVVAMSADTERQKTGETGMSRVHGIGAVLIGATGMESMLHQSAEYGQRIIEILRIAPLTIAEATEVLEAWLPEARALKPGDAVRWRTLVRLQICHDGPTTMRHLESIVREYGRYMDRAGKITRVLAWSEVPVLLDVLEVVAKAKAAPELGINVVRPEKAKAQHG